MPRQEFIVEIEVAIGAARIIAGLGDLTNITVDALVCPSNSFGLMRGGVADAIREVGGDGLERDAIALAPIPVGGAAATAAGRLPCRWVIHAVTMHNPIEIAPRAVVERATTAALHKASSCQARSVAFPGMGTGTGRLDGSIAADAMIGAVESFLRSTPGTSIRLIVLVAWNRQLLEAWRKRLARHSAEQDAGD